MSDINYENRTVREFDMAVAVAATESITRAQKILAGIRGGWQKAVGSALSRAASSGKTIAKKAVSDEYTISQSDFMQNTRNMNHYKRTADGGVEVVFGFKGNVIPLLKFNTKVGKDGKVITQVKRSGSAQILERAFFARMGQHTGIYEREGLERFPVRELYGPATPQMMYSNDVVDERINDKILETFNNRIDHEITRILNGWGV